VAVRAEKGAVKSTGPRPQGPGGEADPAAGEPRPNVKVVKADQGEQGTAQDLPEVPNRAVDGRKDGPLDLGDADQADVDFGSKDGKGLLDLEDADAAGDIDFSTLGAAPDY